ncbi:MAG: DUF4270 family protein, partial [Chitinophagaceae bacterium]
YLFALISLVACNNSDEKAAGPTGSSKEETLQEAIRQYPDSALLKENLVQYYREGGNYDKAISTVTAQLQKDSLNARWWDIQATLYYENGDTMKSIRSFENAVRIYPDPAYIISLGTLYAQTRDPQALAIGDALLLGSKANADKGSNTQKIGDFYFSGMDSARIEKEGLNPLKADLDKINAITDVNGIVDEVANLHRFGIYPFFGTYVDQDAKKSTEYALYFSQAGIGLPDRDYYFKKDKAGGGRDTVLAEFPITTARNPVAATFTHNYTGTAIATQLSNPSVQYPITYLQGLAGVRNKISFPHLQKFANAVGKIVINKAELVIPISTGTDGAPFNAAKRLGLYRTDIAGQRRDITDRLYFAAQYG